MFNYPIGSGGKPAAKKKAPMAPEQEMQAGGEEPEEGSAIAEEHGPAHEVHITHDHAAGAHHVHSMHPDGHEHHSDHASVEEAHEHGKQLASGGEEGAEGDDWGEE